MDEMINAVEEPREIENRPKWYEDINLKDAKAFIRANITTAARSFIAIGYYLKHIRDKQLYLEDGHASIWEFAHSEYGISKSTASRYMTMNDRFSDGGNSPNIAESYQGFGKSQLQEMLALNEEQLEQVTPEMTVLDIRDMARPEESEEEQVPGQIDISEFPEFLPVDMEAREQEPAERRQSFTMFLEDMLGGENVLKKRRELLTVDEYVKMFWKEMDPSLQEIALKKDQAFAELIQERYKYRASHGGALSYEGSIKGIEFDRLNCHDSVKLTWKMLTGRIFDLLDSEEIQPIAISQQTEANPAIDAEFEEILEPDGGLKQIGMLNLSWKSENILRRAGIDTVEELASMSDKEFAAVRGMSKRVMEEIRTKLKDLDSKDKVEPEESMTDLQVARKKLERAKNTLNTCLKDMPDEDNIYIRGMKLTVAAWEALVCEMDIENDPPKPEQPELPLLKNNDQRAAFVDNFETWPLWIETKETGERYYRYDLEDGTSMVVKVYRAMLFDYSISGLSYEERYSEGYGRHEYYLLQPGKFFRDCERNRSALIEKLKEIQKKEKAIQSAN